MNNCEYICRFEHKDANLYTSLKAIPFVNIPIYLLIIIFPFYLYLFVIAIYAKNALTIILSAVCLIIYLIMIFGYRKLITKKQSSQRKLLCANQNPPTEIIFGDKIVINVGENRNVFEYSAVKKIYEYKNLYILLFRKNVYTYFEKNSTESASDAELISMLETQTGLKATKKSNTAVIITALLTTITSVFSILWTISVFIYH